MGVKFSKDLLEQLSCHVETCERLVLVNQLLERLKAQLRFAVSGRVEAVLNGVVVLRQNLPNLLNGCVLPVERAG